MSKIKVFKMISGEEIIGDIVDEHDSVFVVKNPATIMLQQTQQGVGIGLAPYMPYSKGNIKLVKSAIASEAEVEQKMENEYNRIFGSGIEIVPAAALATAR